MASFFSQFFQQIFTIFGSAWYNMARIDLGGISLLQYVITVSMIGFFLPIIFTIVRREHRQAESEARREARYNARRKGGK